MQRRQFSMSWLQTTKVSFISVLENEVKLTSILETEVKIFLTPIIPTPDSFLEKFPTIRLFQTPRLFGTLE